MLPSSNTTTAICDNLMAIGDVLHLKHPIFYGDQRRKGMMRLITFRRSQEVSIPIILMLPPSIDYDGLDWYAKKVFPVKISYFVF